MRLSLLSIVLPLALSGCPSDSGSTTDANEHTHAALETTYDRTSSTLGAANVQDALDELAARPIAEAPLASRLELVVETFPNNKQTLQNEHARCPDEAHDIALSGSCFGASVSSIATTLLGVSTYECRINQTAGSTDMLEVRVLCLRNAR